MAVSWVMEMQNGRKQIHPQGAYSTEGGAIAIIQGVAYSAGGKCWLLLREIEERQLCVCVCVHVYKLMIGRFEFQGYEGIRQVKGAWG